MLMQKLFRSAPLAMRFSAMRGFHLSVQCLADVTINVPSMGDSITEGTVIQLLKKPGDQVEQDEVLAQVETDKVTVDIRSPESGVLKEWLCEEDANVEVGSPFYVLDAGASGGAASSSPAPAPAPTPAPAAAPPAPSPAPTPAPAPAAAQTSGSHGKRQPLIRFRHGKGREQAHHGSTAPMVFEQRPEPPSKATKTYLDIPEMYGRPVISEEEMDAILSGGVPE